MDSMITFKMAGDYRDMVFASSKAYDTANTKMAPARERGYMAEHRDIPLCKGTRSRPTAPISSSGPSLSVAPRETWTHRKSHWRYAMAFGFNVWSGEQSSLGAAEHGEM